MKTKKISLKVMEEDVRPLASSAVTLILNRLSKRYMKAAADLDSAFKDQNKLHILQAIQDLSDMLALTVEELENTTSLIAEVPDLKESPEE